MRGVKILSLRKREDFDCSWARDHDDDCNWDHDDDCNWDHDHDGCPSREQRHVHEVEGSVEIAERQEDPHNHRFATVSGQAIPIGNGDHVHLVRFRTDFYEDHFHEFKGKTGGMIPVGDRHVHFLESVTTVVDGHQHEFRVATLIDDPIGE